MTFYALLIFFGLSPVYAQMNLGTVKTIEQRLAEEIQKMLDAGHLRPAYYNANEFYWQRAEGITVNKTSSNYWSNPAETIYTLIRALPHVPSGMQSLLRTHIQSEWNNYPPTTYSHAGWNGAAREIFDLPNEAFNGPISNYPEGKMSPGTHDAFAWSAYSFNPFNIYAGYLYAKEFGNATTVLDQIRNKVAPIPDDTFLDLTGHPKAHVLNIYIAGYYGYLGLQELAGEAKSLAVQGYLNNALSKRIQILSVPPSQYEGTETGGFLYLVPELANYLNQNAKTQVTNFVNQHEPLMPYWFVSRVDEATRVHAFQTAIRHEGSTSQYYDYASLFNAKALILKEGRTELEKYLDVPSVYRGDLYHIQNLVSTIESGPDLGGTQVSPTQSYVQGDVNRDGIVNVLDFTLLSNAFGTDDVNTDINGDGIVNVLDFTILSNNFGKRL